MLIKLLKDVKEGAGVKINMRRGRPIVFVKGAIIDASDATARKYIAAGLAEAYVEPAQPAE